ncbi:hypothetical protein [Vibrio phage JSF12]|uniref:Uncharacterized protein n=2 Tax=Jesfedecavirus TaxID=2560156 RepID=A0A2D0Z176_9CAUD|nr:hypothetical protein FDI98_gp149 [Vibrio phage JSF10]YP_009794730.1 hypothetical protein HOS35_gp047 [Vibrio phage JSF12]ASV43383.1 hypothetical protein [Vibrio phage JSF10]ASV43565.1 hypothetical protein [Vibrio phage JSF12]
MFVLKQKYVVFSIKDAQGALTPEEEAQILALLSKISDHRVARGKPPIHAVVIDQNALGTEAYESTLNILKTALTAKERAKCPHPNWHVDVAVMGGFDVHTCTECGLSKYV